MPQYHRQLLRPTDIAVRCKQCYRPSMTKLKQAQARSSFASPQIVKGFAVIKVPK